MSALKIIMTAFVLISLLPLCGLTAAATATSDAADNTSSMQETLVASEADLTKALFEAPSKKKRTAILPQTHCNADVVSGSGLLELMFGLEDLRLAFGASLLIPRGAQAPPISPPRSI